jgi:hypothetical protein
VQEGQPTFIYIAGSVVQWAAAFCYFTWVVPYFMRLAGAHHRMSLIYRFAAGLRSAVKPMMWPVPVPLILADVYGLYDDAIDKPWEGLLGSLWYITKAFSLLHYVVWWMCRKHDDDDDFWKRKRRRAKEAVQRVGSRLVVQPMPT